MKAADDMHEANFLAEGGFKGTERTPVEQRAAAANPKISVGDSDNANLLNWQVDVPLQELRIGRYRPESS